MTLDPFLPTAAIVLLFVPPAALLIWQLIRTTGGLRGRWSPIRRIGVLLFLLATVLGPAVPGGSAKAVVSDIDVFLLIDTTTSSNAEDYGPGTTRLDLIKADAEKITQTYGGARYSVISFDSSAVVRVPLISDPVAVSSALETLTVETTAYSSGSSVTEAAATLRSRLQSSQDEHPDRLRLVFYYGDGEQTRDDPLGSFAESEPLISDGGVLGYGTAEGGPMRENNYDWQKYYNDDGSYNPTPPPDPDPQYVLDTSQAGSPQAISTIDEGNLTTIADQLGVGYQHRDQQGAPRYPDVGDQIGEQIDVRDVSIAARYYWIPAIAAFLLLAWEIVIVWNQLSELRRARPTRGVRP